MLFAFWSGCPSSKPSPKDWCTKRWLKIQDLSIGKAIYHGQHSDHHDDWGEGWGCMLSSSDENLYLVTANMHTHCPSGTVSNWGQETLKCIYIGHVQESWEGAGAGRGQSHKTYGHIKQGLGASTHQCPHNKWLAIGRTSQGRGARSTCRVPEKKRIRTAPHSPTDVSSSPQFAFHAGFHYGRPLPTVFTTATTFRNGILTTTGNFPA